MRPAKLDNIQLRSIMLYQASTVSRRKKYSALQMRIAYALSAYKCFKTDISRSADKNVFRHESVADGLPSFRSDGSCIYRYDGAKPHRRRHLPLFD